MVFRINIKSEQVEANVLAKSVLNNICIHINDALPRVSVELQKWIDNTMFFNNPIKEHNVNEPEIG